MFSFYQSPSWSVYFSVFNSSVGTVIGNKYKSDASCTSVYGFTLNGDNIIAKLQWTTYYLAVYKISSDSFTFVSFAGTNLLDLAVDGASQK